MSEKIWLSVTELAEYLGRSKDYIYKLIGKRAIPFSKPTGKCVYFNKNDIEKWLKDGMVK